jgi:hypothetical protein
MTITEKQFQTVVQYGGIILALSIIGNLYFVLRFREVYRDRVRADQQLQQLALRQQAFEGVLREFIPQAANDPKVAEILQRYQIIGSTSATATNQTQGLKP